MTISKNIGFMIVSIFCLQAPLLTYAENTTKASHFSKNRSQLAMKFNNFVYIFLGPKLDPTLNRSVIKTDQLTFTAIGIDFNHKEQVIAIAKEAVANGAQLIELCGGFGPLWIAKVSAAIQNQVPVGSVAYGPEARKPLLDLLS